MIFLIDFENVRQHGLNGCQYLNDTDKLILFYSKNALTANFHYWDTIQKSGCEFEAIKLHNTGKNALDFYIASELARILAKNKNNKACIVSNDKGFHAVKDFWAARGIMVYTQSSIENAIKTFEPHTERGKECISASKLTSVEDFFGIKTNDNSNKVIGKNDLITNLRKSFQGTTYQSSVNDIYAAIHNKERKAAYTSILHTFGRTKGLALYRELKNKDPNKAPCKAYAESK